MTETMLVERGDRVRLLDRPGDVRGVVLAISAEPYRSRRPVKVQLKPGRSDSTFWFATDELERLSWRRDWFEVWASNPKMIREARRVATLRVAEKQFWDAVTRGLGLDRIVAFLDKHMTNERPTR